MLASHRFWELRAACSQGSKNWSPENVNGQEKNYKACMLLNNALSHEDVQKLISCPTAKEKWAALDSIYMESPDLREGNRFQAKKDFYNFKMIEGESISSY